MLELVMKTLPVRKVSPSHPGQTKQAGKGMTLLEVVIAASVTAVALAGLVMAIMSSLFSSSVNRQTAIALNIARQKIAELEVYSNSKWDGGANGLFAHHQKGGVSGGREFSNTDPNLKDPNSLDLGTVDGVTYNGRIFFPVDNPDNDNASLKENYVGGQTLADGTQAPLGPLLVGGGVDLNLDGDVVDTMTTGYLVLPVAVRVSWVDFEGQVRHVELRTMLVEN